MKTSLDKWRIIDSTLLVLIWKIIGLHSVAKIDYVMLFVSFFIFYVCIYGIALALIGE